MSETSWPRGLGATPYVAVNMVSPMTVPNTKMILGHGQFSHNNGLTAYRALSENVTAKREFRS